MKPSLTKYGDRTDGKTNPLRLFSPTKARLSPVSSTSNQHLRLTLLSLLHSRTAMSSNDDLLASVRTPTHQYPFGTSSYPSQLQSSMRNALFTFGASSQQYQNIKAMIDEHIASKPPPSSSTSTAQSGPVFTLAHRPKPRPA